MTTIKVEPWNKAIQPQRSPPIPKEVNRFMLRNYGSLYYNSHDIYERNEILKQIVEKLKIAGYINISVMEVERRLKNMKSHYRRKKADVSSGLVSSVEWEYFKALDNIFTTAETFAYNEMNSEIQKTVQQKRKVEQTTTEPGNIDEKPQDLSMKRPKLIEFNQKSDITNQIHVRPFHKKEETRASSEGSSQGSSQGRSQVPPQVQLPPSGDQFQGGSQGTPQVPPQMQLPSGDQVQTLTMKIIESIKAVDQQRLVLDHQRLAMEVRRYELDVIGYQLSDLLNKISHPGLVDAEN